MNRQQLAEKLSEAKGDRRPATDLSGYAVESILTGRSNYPVSNLVTYVQAAGVSIEMTDMATLDKFCTASVLDIHRVIGLLMKRYKVTPKAVYRKTGACYTPPKSLDEAEYRKLQSGDNPKAKGPLSIQTLLAVCETIHCDLTFKSN